MNLHLPTPRAFPTICCLLLSAVPLLAGETRLPGFDQAMAAKEDVWGLAAMNQPNGASYEFFERLLPPLRYVNASFHYYPIPLSAPNAPVKARLISNGSGLNLPGQARSWNDLGIPFTFHVGPDEFLFGSLADRVSEPALAEGWLPIVQIDYLHPSPPYTDGPIPLNHPIPDPVPEKYRVEAFASTDPQYASNCPVFVKFELTQGTNGYIAIEPGAKGPLKFQTGKLVDSSQQVLAVCDSNWRWERQLLVTRLVPGKAVTLALATLPLEPAAAPPMNAASYDEARQQCADTWRSVLARGMRLETPEPVVNNAWRHLIVQNFELFHGDRIHYSSGNQYDKLYEAEGTDAALGMLAWGYEADMKRWMTPLMDFTRKNLEWHQAGFKLEDLCRYYWQTRDAEGVRALRSHWEKEALLLANTRTNAEQLCPMQQYCGDIHSLVYSLTVNAKGWAALRNLSAVLADMGEKPEAEKYASIATDFRKVVLKAVDASVRRDTQPPFVPVALYTNELPHDPITDRRIGCYYNVVIDYVAASGLFPPGSPEEKWIPDYQEQHRGLCMGMLRAGASEATFWTGRHQIWPLYTTRYVMEKLRRDDPERALVSLYGDLAQGFTRNTFICGEGCALAPVDERGRFMYCPPNSAANSHFLSMLRQMLVQDLDLDDDGQPETLRLAFATPKRWLEDGKSFALERSPTAFGPLSLKMSSALTAGRVTADVHLPGRNHLQKTFLRARVPDGWKVISAGIGSMRMTADQKGTIDLTGVQGDAHIVFHVEKL